VDVPIACRLTATAAGAQLQEWRHLLARPAVRAERVSPTRLSVRLADDLDQVPELLRLAQREKACCPFFDFSIGIEATAITLHVCVPDDAVSVLDDFAENAQ
jgi:hypothetical protein